MVDLEPLDDDETTRFVHGLLERHHVPLLHRQHGRGNGSSRLAGRSAALVKVMPRDYKRVLNATPRPSWKPAPAMKEARRWPPTG
jgi:hypothetical protein